ADSALLVVSKFFDFGSPLFRGCDPHIHLVCYSVFKVPPSFDDLISLHHLLDFVNYFFLLLFSPSGG
ncbi:MAG: hypothetical protein IJ694_02885, partial [Acidaminococcaceae bacterium]|nr:hypothetical protein [Acidaminococcaceae bacterium]